VCRQIFLSVVFRSFFQSFFRSFFLRGRGRKDVFLPIAFPPNIFYHPCEVYFPLLFCLVVAVELFFLVGVVFFFLAVVVELFFLAEVVVIFFSCGGCC